MHTIAYYCTSFIHMIHIYIYTYYIIIVYAHCICKCAFTSLCAPSPDHSSSNSWREPPVCQATYIRSLGANSKSGWHTGAGRFSCQHTITTLNRIFENFLQTSYLVGIFAPWSLHCSALSSQSWLGCENAKQLRSGCLSSDRSNGRGSLHLGYSIQHERFMRFE